MGVVEQALRRPAPSRAHGRAHRERSPGRGRRSWLHRWDQVDGCVQFSAQKRRLSTEASAPGEAPLGSAQTCCHPAGLWLWEEEEGPWEGRDALGALRGAAVGTCCPPVAVQPVSTAKGLEGAGLGQLP